MVEEVTSSCLYSTDPLAANDRVDVSAIDTLVSNFDPMCCFEGNELFPENTSVLITTSQCTTPSITISYDAASVKFCGEGIEQSAQPFSTELMYSELAGIPDIPSEEALYDIVSKTSNEESEQFNSSCVSEVRYEICTSTVADEHPLNQKQKKSSEEKKKGRGSYKHVPHHEKPVQVVERRNARERRRVQSVNSAFFRLRKALPNNIFVGRRGKRISKVKTLQAAMNYILSMQQLLAQPPEAQQAVQM